MNSGSFDNGNDDDDDVRLGGDGAAKILLGGDGTASFDGEYSE